MVVQLLTAASKHKILHKEVTQHQKLQPKLRFSTIATFLCAIHPRPMWQSHFYFLKSPAIPSKCRVIIDGPA